MESTESSSDSEIASSYSEWVSSLSTDSETSTETESESSSEDTLFYSDSSKSSEDSSESSTEISSESVSSESISTATAVSSYSLSTSINSERAEECWDGLDYTLFGNAFREKLKSEISKTGSKTIAYSKNNDYLSESDKALNGETGIIPFYHDENQHTTSWNKEHVWPDSRGAGKSGAGADPQMLRPTAKSCNSARGNKFFGTGSNEYDPARCAADSKNGDSFPLYDASRGEAARIIFYVSAKYGVLGSKFMLSNNPSDATSANTMGTLSYLIQWNNQYPVTAQEIRRNEYLDGEGFSRNPFIDNRDLANYIWDENGFRTSAYEGGLV